MEYVLALVQVQGWMVVSPRPEMGVPPCPVMGGIPHPRLDRGTPPMMGYPPVQGWGTPPSGPWMGYPPPH